MIYVEMYQPLVMSSPKSKLVAIPVISNIGVPLALFVRSDEIEGFYRANDKFYACLYKTMLKGIRWTPKLINEVKLDVVDAREFPSNGFEENAVIRIAVLFTVPHYCASTCNAVVIHIKGGSVLVPVTDLYKYYRFITEKFPACVELFAKELVNNDKIATKAAEICAKVFGTTLNTCDSLRAHIVVAACTLIVARMYSHPLTMRELVVRYNLPRSKLYEVYRYIAEKLGVSIKEITIDVHTYIRHLVSALVGDPVKAQGIAEEAIKLYDLAKRYGITDGRDPKALAAASVYIVANERGARVTQLQLIGLTHSTEVTIRKRIKELKQLLRELQNTNHVATINSGYDSSAGHKSVIF